ncbi:MAG: ATPase [Chlorobi bacterium]|nr:ATPase [Chlorobiota bacterium]
MSGTSFARKDRFIKEKRHDVYREMQKHAEPAKCPSCGAVFVNGRWQWQGIEKDAVHILCPACKRTADNYPAGEIEFGGIFFLEHRNEIINLVMNTERQEKKLHPLERIMHITHNEATTAVTTTGIHVARRISEAVAKAFKGHLSLRYGDGEQSLTARWMR